MSENVFERLIPAVLPRVTVEEWEFLDFEQFCNFSVGLAMRGSSFGTSEPPRRGVISLHGRWQTQN